MNKTKHVIFLNYNRLIKQGKNTKITEGKTTSDVDIHLMRISSLSTQYVYGIPDNSTLKSEIIIVFIENKKHPSNQYAYLTYF